MVRTPVRRELDSLVRQLLAPLLKPARGRRRWELLSLDVEQGICLVLRRGQHLILVELEARDESLACYARTDRFNLCARRVLDEDAALSQEDRRLLDALVRLLRRRETLLPVFERPTTSRRVMIREIEVDQMLVPEGRGLYYLNPYVGCMIGCAFCYVAPRADFSRSLEGLPRMEWGRYVDVKVNAADILRRQVRTMRPGIVRISPIVTDPYQSLERSYRITRQCLEVLLGSGFTPVILTRAARVLEDLDLIRQFPGASVAFSIPSDDDRMRQCFEPGADPVEARLEALAQCRAAGVHTMAVVQPVLPMNPQHLVAQLAPHVRAVRIDRMHHAHRFASIYADYGLSHAAEAAFFDRLVPQLRSAFCAAGVLVDDLDDLRSVIERTGG